MSTEHTHPCVMRCGRPADGYFLCHGCTDDVAAWLATVDTLARELDTTISRQSRFSQSVPVATSGPAPLPYDPGVAETADILVNTLTTWARDLAERLGHGELPETSPGAVAAWLRANAHSFRTHPAAGELADEITYAISKAWRAVDRAPGKVYIGPCGAEDCSLDLYGRADPARPGRLDPRQSVVRCPCGAQWDATKRRDWLFERLHDSLATAREIASAVGMIGDWPLNEKTIRTWYHRGRIVARGHNASGVPLHRIGDVVHAIATKAATRRDRSGETIPAHD